LSQDFINGLLFRLDNHYTETKSLFRFKQPMLPPLFHPIKFQKKLSFAASPCRVDLWGIALIAKPQAEGVA